MKTSGWDLAGSFPIVQNFSDFEIFLMPCCINQDLIKIFMKNRGTASGQGQGKREEQPKITKMLVIRYSPGICEIQVQIPHQNQVEQGLDS